MRPKGPCNLSTMSPGKESGKEGQRLARMTRIRNNNNTIITALEDEAGWDGGSQSSDAHIIKETRTFTVESSAAGEDHVSL